MKKITNFHILRITMRGFKRFCDEYSIDLDRITYIHGANGEGKSTIADAIAYAFCGTPFWGEKSCERLMNPDCTEMSVEVQFVDDQGEVHTLTRRRAGNSTTIVFDTMTVRQSDVVNLFTEKDVFLSLLNPLYFIEKIAEDGREFLQKLVPVVKQEEILAQMSESERTLLEHESLLDPEYFIKQRREELKEYEESTVYLEGQRDLLNQQYDEAVAKLDAALKRGNEIVARKSELEKKQFEGVDVAGLKAKKAEIDSLNAEISALSTDCAKLAAKIKSIRPGDICPTCRTAVTAENYRSIIAALRIHAPCIINLSTGEIAELSVYQPHPSEIGEVSTELKKGYFSFSSGAGANIMQNPENEFCEATLPKDEEIITPGHFCYDCRRIIADIDKDGYVIADMYDPETVSVFKVWDGAKYEIRDYLVTVNKTEHKNLEIEVHGLLEQED